MSKSEFKRLEIMNPTTVQKIRDQIAEDIEKIALANPAQGDLDDFWVAGMLYAAKIAKSNTDE